jgi:hypothetical protein
MRARIKIITCFIALAILKILKIGEREINYYKIYDTVACKIGFAHSLRKKIEHRPSRELMTPSHLALCGS